ncbi:MAG: hypothetical protein PVF83_08290 [Anaerolineales bacterium]
MSTRIEMLDEKRRRYRGGHLKGFAVFFVAWMARTALMIVGVENDLVYTILMIVLLLSALFQGYYGIKGKRIEDEIRKEPFLQEALNNELIRLYELKAWRVAFFSVIGFVFVAAVVSLFVEFNDIMLVFLTTFLVGFGTYNIAIYVLDR